MVAGGKLFALGSGLANTTSTFEPSKQAFAVLLSQNITVALKQARPSRLVADEALSAAFQHDGMFEDGIALKTAEKNTLLKAPEVQSANASAPAAECKTAEPGDKCYKVRWDLFAQFTWHSIVTNVHTFAGIAQARHILPPEYIWQRLLAWNAQRPDSTWCIVTGLEASKALSPDALGLEA
ncbi:hypothetical protein AK812_SmicGene21689 [Symbiodinium microadriaticum]|uniref:Uncharacterized protein n=1 Tax=Symbiodinium microadriaticum TaxID=2951 RepID=A0A1Q9DLU1_SYMMI|nr:hypothetical protein AK812_SmicGene21689 [Symbiodinium microadriaticum]